MVYGLQWVANHPVYRLHEAVAFFVQTGLQQASFGDSCFPAWFKPIVDASPKLRRLFEDVFTRVRAEGVATRNSLEAAWECQDNVQVMCEGPHVALLECTFKTATLRAALNNLFEYLYKEALVGKTFEDAVGSTLSHHYQQFRNLGQRVCPFCGLENYKDRKTDTRASYDHFLLRSRYPLAAVNFRNIIPMCDICNEAPNKGVKDVLFSDKGRTKRRAIQYPYGQIGGVTVSLTLTSPAQPGLPASWAVSTDAQVPAEAPRVNTWKSVFQIEKRYAARMGEASDTWIRDFLKIKAYSMRPSTEVLRQDFLSYSDSLSSIDRVKETAEAPLRAAFFRFLATQVAPETLEGYSGISTSLAVTAIPVALAAGN